MQISYFSVIIIHCLADISGYNRNGIFMNIEVIGIVHSPFQQRQGTPVQPKAAKNIKATIEIKQEFADGLADIDGFSHIVVLFGFHKSTDYKLRVKPYLDDELKGVFATRAPKRPSQIGLSIVKLEKVCSNILHITGADMLDGTPVFDIKPYLPSLNPDGEIKIGWLREKYSQFEHKKADDRF